MTFRVESASLEAKFPGLDKIYPTIGISSNLAALFHIKKRKQGVHHPC